MNRQRRVDMSPSPLKPPRAMNSRPLVRLAAATVLGPLVGTLAIYYVTDTASSYTSAWLLIVGVALVLLVLFFPKGILGTLRQRWLGWLP